MHVKDWIFMTISLSFIFILILFYVTYIIKNKNKNTSKVSNPLVVKKYSINNNGNIEKKINEIVVPVFSVFKKTQDNNNKLYFLSPTKKLRSFGHGLFVGGTGRGKTTKLIEPIILFNAQIQEEKNKDGLIISKNKPSFFIPDPNTGTSESLYEKYSSYLITQGYKIKVLNLDSENIDLKSEKINSDFYNPMLQIWMQKNNIDLLHKTIEFFTNAIIPMSSNSSDNPHWDNSARNIISGFIMYMIESEKYSIKTFNISNLSYLLTKKFSSIAMKLSDENKFPKSNTYTRLTLNQMYLEKGKINRELSSILSTINSRVQLLRRPLLHKVTSKNNIDLKDIVHGDKPTAIFIRAAFDSFDVSVLSLLSIFVQDLATYRMKTIEGRSLMFLIDEFNSFPIIEKLVYFLERGRKHNLWFFLFVQSLGGVLEKYKAQGGLSLSNFFIKQILGSDDKGDADLILNNKKNKEVKTLFDEEALLILRGIEPIKVNLDPIQKLDVKLPLFENKENFNDMPKDEIVVEEDFIFKKTKTNNRKEFESWKSEVLNIFKLFYSKKELNEFKEVFIDKLSYDFFKDEDNKILFLWKEILFEFKKIKKVEDEDQSQYDLKIKRAQRMFINMAPSEEIKLMFT